MKIWSKSKLHTQAITAFIIAILLAVVVLGGCGKNDKPSIPTLTTAPSREDIIQAVQRSVEGKTYTVPTQSQEPRLKT